MGDPLLDFDQTVVGGELAEYLKLSQQIGGEVAEHAALVRAAFEAQRTFLTIATRVAKPSEEEVGKLLAETSNAISNVQKFREARRASSYFNHLSAVSESVPALAWVAVSPTPAPHVKEMNDAGQFYGNRVLKEWKERPPHPDWVRAWTSTLTSLQNYVKRVHTTGLVWGRGAYKSGAASAPPPPSLPTYDMSELSIEGGSNDERAALFAELNRGEDVTRGLKRVTDEMKSHKNPGLKSGPTADAPTAVTFGYGPKSTTTAPPAKPPKFMLEGKKWLIENQMQRRDLVLERTEMGQVVYVFGCRESTLKVSGKVNSIVLDSCTKTALVFDSVVASVEFVNCRDCQMQVLHSAPTIAIDKVDGLQMFLSRDSLNVEIVSSKSSALNVMLPVVGQEGEYTEVAVPEQFKTVVKGRGLVTTPTELVGV